MLLNNLDLGLSEEQASKIEEFIKNNFISRKYHENKLDELKNNNHESMQEKTSKQKEEYESKVKALEQQMLQKEQDFEKSIKKLKMDHAVNDYLKSEGARNLISVLAHIKFDKLQLGENDTIIGLEDQVKNLKAAKETSFLFQEPAYYGQKENRFYSDSTIPSVVDKEKVSIDPLTERLNEIARSKRRLPQS